MPPPSAPVPIRAWFWPQAGHLLAQFRPRLAAGLSDERGYDLRAVSRDWECTAAVVPPGRGHFLYGSFDRLGVRPPDDSFDYAGNDLVGVNGLLVQPFANFPLKILLGPGPSSWP